MRAGQMKGKETEAKFLIQSTSIQRKILSLRTLGPFHLIGCQSERQQNIYWDTQDLRLRRARAALKMRWVGSRTEVTFKREIAYRNGISDRVEITVQVPLGQRSRIFKSSRLIDPARPIEPIRLARKIAGSLSLQKVLTLRTFRRKLLFACGRQRIELDLDRVVVQKGSKSVAIHHEVELENLNASEDLFREALKGLMGQFGRGLRSSRIPKYEIGLRLLKSMERNKGSGV